MGILREIYASVYFPIVLIFYLKDFLLYKYFWVKKNESNYKEININGKVVVVTGGSAGMGKVSAKEFAKRGATVIIGDVDLKNGQKTVDEIKNETGNSNVKMLKLDLSDMDSVEAFAKQISAEHPKIKILLNNAGIGSAVPTKTMANGINNHVAINYLGHFLLTNLLLKNLKAEEKARVVSMSSTIQLMSQLDVEDLNMEKSGYGFENSLPYANTKFCLALFTKELGRRLSGSDVHTYALCPGLKDTNINKNLPSVTDKLFGFFLKYWSFYPEQAASEFILPCALDESIQNETGKMYRFRKYFGAAEKRLDDQLARNLWEKSSQMAQLPERLARV